MSMIVPRADEAVENPRHRVFAEVPSHPGIIASNIGEIYRVLDGAIEPLRVNRHYKGYLRVKVNGATRYVHALVCSAFHGERPSAKHVTRHLNDLKDDCHCDNVVWGLASDNISDAFRNGRVSMGEYHTPAKITDEQVDEIRELLSRGVPQRQIAKVYGIGQAQVSRIKRNVARKFKRPS